MICPKCKSLNTTVTDSRMSGNHRRRRLKCNQCGEKFTTYEVQAYEMRLMEKIKDTIFEYEDSYGD